MENIAIPSVPASLPAPGEAEMRRLLAGMHWTAGKCPLPIPYFGSAFKCAMVFKRNLAEIAWHWMRTLENNPTTLPQTQTILGGQSVGGISIFDLMQVKHYGDAAKRLTDLVRMKAFRLDQETASRLQGLSGREEALAWGALRTGAVSIAGVEYTPPGANALDRLAQKAFSWLGSRIQNPKERAIATFLFLSRSQFFFDANKRTASLMMNGILMTNGYLPITVLNTQSERFHDELRAFYESGNADGMFAFFSDIVSNLYHGLPTEELQTDPFQN